MKTVLAIWLVVLITVCLTVAYISATIDELVREAQNSGYVPKTSQTGSK